MDRKLLLVLVLSMLTMFAVQFFMHRYSGNQATSDIQPGQPYKLPSHETLTRPLQREIDFIDQKVTQKEEITTVETPLCIAEFSTHGGSLSSLTYKQRRGVNNKPLQTIHSKGFTRREEDCFLVALDEKTPYFYQRTDFQDLEKRMVVAYRTDTQYWTIVKTFSIYKNVYRIDLDISLEPKTVGESGKNVIEAIRPRIFFPAPYVPEVPQESTEGFVYNQTKKAVEKIARDQEANPIPVPDIVGGEDKYFANGLIGDAQRFVQRSYYKRLGDYDLFTILEGPEVIEKQNFSLAFYFGPKDLHDLTAVDARLEGLLQFGWLSWICKLLIKLLEFLYSYIPNYGVAIIILAILLKVPLIPFTMKSSEVMEKHQRLQPQINHIRRKYKNDMQKQQQEMMRLYKEHNLSPAGQVFGCLPLLINLPIIFSLYKVLGNYMDLYNAPFVLWITDLSIKDPYFVLPILMGISMWWQQRLMPSSQDKNSRMMLSVMPIVMTAIFAYLSAGVVLYWLTNNLLMVGETYLRRALKR